MAYRDGIQANQRLGEAVVRRKCDGGKSSDLSAVIDNANQQVTDPSGNVHQRSVMIIDHHEG
jgi:nanoRNase/pAp phosphatase (c-di-AMP/oligoRNAs hydrolase)